MSNNGLCGSATRALKREMNPSAFTRAQALRFLSECDDPSVRKVFEGHQNKHVKRAAARPFQGWSEVPNPAVREQTDAMPQGPLNQEIHKVPFNSVLNALEMLATAYGEELATVEEIHDQKLLAFGADEAIAATKRSLISRKSARSAKAKKLGNA